METRSFKLLPSLGQSVQVESDFQMIGRRRSSPESEPEKDMLSDHNPNRRLGESEEGDIPKTMSIEKEAPAKMDDSQDRLFKGHIQTHQQKAGSGL